MFMGGISSSVLDNFVGKLGFLFLALLFLKNNLSEYQLFSHLSGVSL